MTTHIPAEAGLPGGQCEMDCDSTTISTQFGESDARKAKGIEPADRPNLELMPDSGSGVGHPASPDRKAEANAKDVKLRNAWEKAMKDLGTIGKPHRNTAVLMVYSKRTSTTPLSRSSSQQTDHQLSNSHNF